MTSLCIRIYHFFRNHRPAFWLSMVALFVFFGFFASRIHLEEDLNKLMPSSKNPDGTTKLAFSSLRVKDKTYILFHGRKGTDPEKIADVCDAFVDSSRQRTNASARDSRSSLTSSTPSPTTTS